VPIPAELLDDIRIDITARHAVIDWNRHFPWWPQPADVKILFYADGGIQFNGGSFFGLKQVIATLGVNHYPWVRFHVTTVNRISDPSADHQNLDLAAALALDSFDELWIYSFDATPQLTTSELAAAKTFMDTTKGGVLITGDHANLGAAFGNLPRAGKMRLLPAPPNSGVTMNSTLRSGANSLFEFDDQSDDTPQPLSLKWYPAGIFWRAPHQVLCSPYGPIDIFPDHQHEGEAIAPAPSPASEWPGGVGAEVIASGTIIDPNVITPRTIGVLSTYEGHPQGVGRILADSTWHHHFDINLRGLGTPGRTGYVNPGTADWETAAKKIEHFFVNAAIWLAPPARQAEMRWAAWWPILWSDIIVEASDLRHNVRIFGKYAYDALGRYAPQCAVWAWIWELVPVAIRKEFPRFIDKGDPPPLHFYVAGAVTAALHEAFVEKGRNAAHEPPSVKDFERVVRGAVMSAVDALAADLESTARSLRQPEKAAKTTKAAKTKKATKAARASTATKPANRLH
jgi:hypothetical protein